MKKRIAPPVCCIKLLIECLFRSIEQRVIFGMYGYPVGCDGLEGRERLARFALSLRFTEESPDIML